MVPSWTETLLHCGANVVGRTRFCIHPEAVVANIPAVGGTKDMKWELVSKLAPDLLLLDQEENPKSIQEESPIPTFVTHIEKVQDVAYELRRLGEFLGSSDSKAAEQIQSLSERWDQVLKNDLTIASWRQFPGVMKWIREPSSSPMKAAYVIWKKPFMAASRQTFIGSMLERLGVQNVFDRSSVSFAKEKYPEFAIEDLSPDTILLFSSEPFPFAKFEKELANYALSSALVDGEVFSWFGLRSLEFLESLS